MNDLTISASTKFPKKLSFPNQLPGTLDGLRDLAMYKREFEQAEKYAREGLDISRQTHNDTHPTHINSVLWLAEIHYVRGAYADAEREAASALDLLRRSAFRKSHYQLRGLSLLSLVHSRTNRPSRASAFLREALKLSHDLPDVERSRGGLLLGEALIALKRGEEARTLIMKTQEFHARTNGGQHPDSVRMRQRLQQLGAPRASQNRLR